MAHLQLEKRHTQHFHLAEQVDQLLRGRQGNYGAVDQSAVARGSEKGGQRQVPGPAGRIQQGGLQGAKGSGMLRPGHFSKQPPQELLELRGRSELLSQNGGSQGLGQEGQAGREGFSGNEGAGHPFAVPRLGGVGRHFDHQVLGAFVYR